MKYSLSKEDYFNELQDIKKKLKDFVKLIENGDLSYYKDLSLKLRIFYIYKSGTKSLLKTLSELYNFEVKVYISYSSSDKAKKDPKFKSLADALIFEQVNSVVSWFESGDEFIDIFDAIHNREILIDNKYLSYKELIEYIADKMGGAHIDKKIDEKYKFMTSKSFIIGGLPIAQRAIFDTSIATIKLISYIEEYITKNRESKFILKK
jgi:hypothetical protein